MKLQLVEEARERLRPWLGPTPLVRAHALSQMLGREVWLKLETQQPTGSFKVRPAFNAMLAQLDEARAKGVVTSSSGNFAQAVAYAGAALGVRTKIVMTSSTAPFKIERTRRFGGDVVLCGPTFQERWDTTARVQAETGGVLLHPYDADETIAGDGTLALELLEQLAGEFTIVVPTSGGGLIAGIASATKALRPACRVVGVQTSSNGSMARSLNAGRPVNVGAFRTLADALVAAQPGEKTFEIVRRLVDEFVLVDDVELVPALRLLFEEQKLVAEPGGAAAVAALLAGKIQAPGAVVCVVSGGNIELQRLAELVTHGWS